MWSSHAWRALVRLHAFAGSRAALRSLAIGVALVIFAFGMMPDPAFTLMTFVVGVVAPDAPREWNDLPQARLLLAFLALGFAAVGARRVSAGATGWMASLPVSRTTARRGAWAGAAIAALPVAVLLVLACLVSPVLYRVVPRAGAVLGVPCMIAAAAAVALPVRHPWSRALAALALVAAARADVLGILVSLALVVAWDRAAGGLTSPIGTPRMPRMRMPRALAPRSASGLALRWTWRAAGARAFVEALLLPALLVGFTALARRNNSDLAPGTLDVIARLGAGLGVAAAVAGAAAAILARRAPWPWPRSLPWSARHRVALDVAAVLLPATLVVVAAVALLGPVVLPAVIGVALVAAPSAAGALRAGAGRQTGAAGEPALLGAIVAPLLSWWPWLVLVAVPVGLVLARRAERRDREQAGAVRWNELRHDLASDTGWISRS